ncbi:hypothetical protein B0J14DRAFT_74489 [Halenospora varia]|nr:hypothetical protein B0J14DRAFT_74489 [Halenospora varia]
MLHIWKFAAVCHLRSFFSSYVVTLHSQEFCIRAVRILKQRFPQPALHCRSTSKPFSVLISKASEPSRSLVYMMASCYIDNDLFVSDGATSY